MCRRMMVGGLLARTKRALAALILSVPVAAAVATSSDAEATASDPSGGTAISDMNVEIKQGPDGQMEIHSAITYDPKKISRDELVATLPGLCTDFGGLRVGSVSDGKAKEHDNRVLLVQCL